MQGLAEFILRGRRQATLVVGLSVAVPLLFWFGAVVLALVILRRGLSEGIPVVIWGGLPALAWAALGNPAPLLVLLSIVFLASLLRERLGWGLVVSIVAPLALAHAMLLLALWHDTLVAVLNVLQSMPQMFADSGQSMSEAELAFFNDLSLPALAGSYGAVYASISLICLILARAWQARLFNPGGFREEFHRLRLNGWVAATFLVLVFGVPEFNGLAVAPICALPLVLAGLALVHGIVGIKQLSSMWLVVVYIALVFAVPLIMILAFIDSLFDFRSRLQPVSGPGGNDDSNGQG